MSKNDHVLLFLMINTAISSQPLELQTSEKLKMFIIATFREEGVYKSVKKSYTQHEREWCAHSKLGACFFQLHLQHVVPATLQGHFLHEQGSDRP